MASLYQRRRARRRGRSSPLSTNDVAARLTTKVLRTHKTYRRSAHSSRGETALVASDAVIAALNLRRGLRVDPALVGRLIASVAESEFTAARRILVDEYGDKRIVRRGVGMVRHPSVTPLALPETTLALRDYAVTCSERFRSEIDRSRTGFSRRDKDRIRTAAHRRLEADMCGFDFLFMAEPGGPRERQLRDVASVALHA